MSLDEKGRESCCDLEIMRFGSGSQGEGWSQGGQIEGYCSNAGEKHGSLG